MIQRYSAAIRPACDHGATVGLPTLERDDDGKAVKYAAHIAAMAEAVRIIRELRDGDHDNCVSLTGSRPHDHRCEACKSADKFLKEHQ